MRKFLFLNVLLLLCVYSIKAADDWGETGHRATGQIAENHLTKKAKRAIDNLLNGESLAFVSTFADEIRSDRSYPNYGPWHYVNFPFGSTYENHPKSKKGDLYVAIINCIEILKSSSSSKEEKAFNLKMLVHFIGDLHQPMHVGIAEDRGGNKFQVDWFGDGTNLHSVWDYKVIESYNMSYSELVTNADELSERQIEELQKTSVKDWMYESRTLCEEVYANTKMGENLSYKYRYIFMPKMRDQIQRGGIRLAGLLNEIFN